MCRRPRPPACSARPELREKVLDAAARLSYTANPHARAPALSASDIVGLLVHDIADPCFSLIAAGATRVAGEQGAIVVPGTTFREIEYAATLRARRARAIVLVGSRTTDLRMTSRLAGVPVRGRPGGARRPGRAERPDGVSGQPDGRRPSRPRGRFAVLCGPPGLVTARERLDGFRAGLAAPGGTACDVVAEAFTRDGGYASALELVRHGMRVRGERRDGGRRHRGTAGTGRRRAG